MKAYRKLAAQWHPDQYNGNDKQNAEKMFIDIAAAKEVLTDPGLLSVVKLIALFQNIVTSMTHLQVNACYFARVKLESITVD